MSPTTSSHAAAASELVIDAMLRSQSSGSIDRFRRVSLDAIDKRLSELDRERDLDQVLEANGAALALAGVGLGVVSKKWLIVPAIVCGFLLQHALQGRCLAVPLLRGLGFRSATEIELERESLESIRREFTQSTRDRDVVPSVARSPPMRGAGAGPPSRDEPVVESHLAQGRSRACTRGKLGSVFSRARSRPRRCSGRLRGNSRPTMPA